MRYLTIGLMACMLAGCGNNTEPGHRAQEADRSAARSAPANVPAEANPGAYPGPIPKPVLVGQAGRKMDACGTFAVIANVEPQGYASVRDAPSDAVKERERLEAGHGVQVCGSEEGWSGIVYRDEGDNATDCGVGTPVEETQAYTGPCRSGWIEAEYLEMIAG